MAAAFTNHIKYVYQKSVVLQNNNYVQQYISLRNRILYIYINTTIKYIIKIVENKFIQKKQRKRGLILSNKNNSQASLSTVLSRKFIKLESGSRSAHNDDHVNRPWIRHLNYYYDNRNNNSITYRKS